MKIKKIYEIMLSEDENKNTKMILVPFTESSCKVARIINTDFLIFANDENDAKIQARERVQAILDLVKNTETEEKTP